MLWTRMELKDRAKAVLRNSYWTAFVISLLVIIAGNVGSSAPKISKISQSGALSIDYSVSIGIFPGIIVGFFIFVFVTLFVFAVRLFVGYPVQVGAKKYFIQTAQGQDNSKYFEFAFNGANYMKIVLTMLLKDVQNFLWTLLFIIPGIIKYYSYRMVPYILADNPNIGYKRAIKLSCDMTNFHKVDIFLLDLSFLGWILLGFLALFVGVMFVYPYINATEAELYMVLRKNALNNGICTYDELQLKQQAEVV